MSQLRGIEADFATWRPVQGRKVLQLVFEVPIEKTQHVLDILGIPQSGASKWCAIALLDPKAVKPEAEGQAERSDAATIKKHWADYSRAQQAAILCSDPDFRAYFGADNAIHCEGKLSLHLRIGRKRDLDLPENHARWDEFVALYHMHRDRLK